MHDQKTKELLNSPLLALLAALLFTMLLAAPAAKASKSQRSIIEDPARVLSPDPVVRDAALNEAAALGVDILKVPVLWRDYAPDGTSTVRPSGDLSRPETYGTAAWAGLDAIVSGAESRGLKIWLMITAPAPRWAVAKETSPGLGAYLPSARDYGDFVAAVGRRYPSVHYFSMWNEVNIKRFMQPVTHGVVESAIHYREMYRAGYSALGRTGHRRDTITFGELMPRSQVPDPNVTRPIAWLREFFCLDRRGRALRGRTATRHKCTRFKRLHASGIAYHPYRLTGGPVSRETSRDNAAIGNLNRVEKVLDEAYKARHLANRRLRIYNTEFGYQTDPPDPGGKSLSRAAQYLNMSEYITWRDPRVATYSQYLIVDDPDLGGFQSGLRFADGTIKPVFYDAYETPLLVMRTRSRNRVTVWGCLRSKPSGGTNAELQVRSGSDWVTVRTIRVTSSRGYFEQSVALRGVSSKQFRIAWSGGVSRIARAQAPVRPRRD